jgi:hypothetical protein
MQISKHALGAAAMTAACLLSACGGSDGGDAAHVFGSAINAAAASDKITVTSRPVVSLYEGSTAVFYTATATDSAGKTMTYALSGTDAAKFNLNTATGALSFKTAPSYADPTDASGDNNYLVTLTASDGTTSASQGLSVLVAQNIPSRAYSWNNAPFGGGGYISGLVYHPTSKNLLYARTDVGGAYRWNATTSTWTPLNDSLGSADSQLMGVLSLAVDPENANLLYLATGQYVATWAEDAALRSGRLRRRSRDRRAPASRSQQQQHPLSGHHPERPVEEHQRRRQLGSGDRLHPHLDHPGGVRQAHGVRRQVVDPLCRGQHHQRR